MTSGSELRIGINNILDKDPQAWEGLAGRGLRAGRRNPGCRLCRLG
jgi:hypothetical protein